MLIHEIARSVRANDPGFLDYLSRGASNDDRTAIGSNIVNRTTINIYGPYLRFRDVDFTNDSPNSASLSTVRTSLTSGHVNAPFLLGRVDVLLL